MPPPTVMSNIYRHVLPYKMFLRQPGTNDFKLGQEYYDQQKYTEAERYFQQSARQREKVLGAEYKDTLMSRHWAALTVYKQQRYTEAERLFQRVVQQQEKALGVEHEDTLYSMHWGAKTVYKQQRYTEAERLFQRLVQRQEKALGIDHEDTLYSMHWGAKTVYKQQRYVEAEQLLQQLVQQQEKALGAEHEDTLYSKHWGAKTVYKQQRYAEAERLLQQLVQQQETILGAEHQGTLRSKRDLQLLFGTAVTILMNTTTETIASRLADYFIGIKNSRAQYTDSEIFQISLLLKQLNPKWSKVPRTYIILRAIGCLNFLDIFIDLDFSDYWLPVTERRLPSCLRPSQRSEFVATQNSVLTKSMDLEKGEAGQHCHFRRDESLPFEEKGILGCGGSGQVDKVLSLISFKEYARKRVNRNIVFGRRKEDVKRFIAEIEVLKRLKHRHVVEFVGSYSDPKYIALIMSPVAEMDLSTYLVRTDESGHGELRTFFGCLARGLEFLHEQQVRHKDIKPSNILVCNGKILFTDFGLSFDFTDAEGSTTVSMINGMTPRYCAPEVANYEPRNTASDIWSLGVVFLEMIAVLKSRTVEHIYQFLKEHGSLQTLIRTNPSALLELVAELRGTENIADNIALEWVQKMLLVQQQLRPTAASLVASIISTSKEREGTGNFCGICCILCDDDSSDEFDELEDNSQYGII